MQPDALGYRVLVGADAAPTATFTYFWDGIEVLQLDASVSQGDIVAYEWDFTCVPGGPDVPTSDPLATSSRRRIR